MGRQRNIHSKEHLKKLQRSHEERRKAIGFYKKGGKTRPITKKKPRKTRVVKKVVPTPVALARRPPGYAWKAWIIDNIKKAGENPDLVTIQPDPNHIAIYPKWAPVSVFNDDNMKRFNPIMKGVGARWNESSSRWTIRKTPEDVGWVKNRGKDDTQGEWSWNKGSQIVEVSWTDVDDDYGNSHEVAWVTWRNNAKQKDLGVVEGEEFPSWDDAVDFAETWIMENQEGMIPVWENPQDGYLETGKAPKGTKVLYVTRKDLHGHNQLISADIERDARG